MNFCPGDMILKSYSPGLASDIKILVKRLYAKTDIYIQYAMQCTSNIQSNLSIKLLQNSPQNRTRFMTNPPENSHQSRFSSVSSATTCLALFASCFYRFFGNKFFHIVVEMSMQSPKFPGFSTTLYFSSWYSEMSLISPNKAA